MPELETVRMVADWLANGTNGAAGPPGGVSSVNALLPSVPRDTSDPQPENVVVYDSTRDGWVARLHVPYEASGVSYPALAVFAGEITQNGEVLTTIRDGTADIVIAVVDERSDSAPGIASALYTARAVKRSLKKLSEQINAGALYDTVCVRNSIALRGCAGLKDIRGAVMKGGIVLVAGVVATYHVRDEAP